MSSPATLDWQPRRPTWLRRDFQPRNQALACESLILQDADAPAAAAYRHTKGHKNICCGSCAARNWFVSCQSSTGFADPRGHETGFVAGQAEPQVSPPRCAPVEMTILLENWRCRVKSSISNEFVIPTEAQRSGGTCCLPRYQGIFVSYQKSGNRFSLRL